MFRTIANEVWAFDAEWVPDVASGRRVYDVPAEASDEEVLDTMWEHGGATDENPHPYLKTVLCRIVSISVVIRKSDGHGTSVKLVSLPERGSEPGSEASIVSRFLNGIGKSKPQLVGFNSRSADLPILVQRAMVNRVIAREFCRRPAKPWEGVDYFAKGSDWHVDLKGEEYAGWGRATPSLHEFATCCGIPGKTLIDGRSVVDLWRAGDVRRIVQYNECDAITTYLLWLRAALLAGHFTLAQHETEEQRIETMLRERAAADAGGEHLADYLDTWRQLRGEGAVAVLVGA